MFVLNFWLKEFLLSAFANRFELRREPKQLTRLYYKLCPCLASQGKVYKFDGQWNKNYVADIAKQNINLSARGQLRCENFVW